MIHLPQGLSVYLQYTNKKVSWYNCIIIIIRDTTTVKQNRGSVSGIEYSKQLLCYLYMDIQVFYSSKLENPFMS